MAQRHSAYFCWKEKSNMKNEYVETYYKDRMGPGLVEEYSSKLWKSQHCH